MVAGLGGPSNVLSPRFAGLARAPVTLDVPAPRSGFVSAMDTRGIGLAVIALGGGRLRAADAIDSRVGFSRLRAIGSAVQQHEPLARVHASSRGDAALGRDRLLSAIKIGDEGLPGEPIVLWSSAPG
jgi:thymidine phosphorylase